jgi:putative flippase GtrA
MDFAAADRIPAEVEPPHRRIELAFVPQLSRYFSASVIALAIDVAVYAAFCVANVNALLAGTVGYAVGMLAHYILSTAFVFDVEFSRKSASRRLTEFAITGLLGLILTAAIIGCLTNHFAAPAMIAKAAAVVVSFFAVFLLRRWIVFAAGPQKPHSDADRVYLKEGSRT